MDTKALILVTYLQVAAWLSIAWGMSILKTGNIRFFLVRRRPGDDSKSVLVRLQYAALYICPGVGGLVIVLLALFHRHRAQVGFAEWLWMHLGWFAAVGGADLFGIVLLAIPELGLAWARSAYPQISPSDRDALLTMRLVGAGSLGFGITFFTLALKGV